MTGSLANQIATMTEMREPQKVLDRANGKPLAVMKTSRGVAYFAPVEGTLRDNPPRYATLDDVQNSVRSRRHVNRLILDCLKDN